MLDVLPLIAMLALGQAANPEIVGDAVVIRVHNQTDEGTFVVPLDQLAYTRNGSAVFESSFPITFPTNDGFSTIAVVNSFSVEFTRASTIRLAFDVTSGPEPTHFSIATGNLDCRDTPASFAAASASLNYFDNNLDGGGLTGDYTHPNSPIFLQYAFGAFYDQRSPLNNPVGYLISPLMLDIGNAARGEGRFPVSGDLVPFEQPISRLNSAFSFTLSGFDTARGNSVYFVSPNQRCGLGDVASVGGDLIPDTVLTPDDIVAYLGAFFAGDSSIADLAQVGGAPSPDGLITADDLVAFLTAFFAGCAG